MFNSIISYINTRLLTTGYFTQVYEFVELKKQKDTDNAPMLYCSNGEWKDVTNFDQYNGTSYVRLLRQISFDRLTNTRVSGENLLRITMPLRVVGIVKNSFLTDNNYRSVNMGQDMAKVLSVPNSPLNTTINARNIDFNILSIELNSESILSQEMPNMKDRYEYTIVAVDINVLVEIKSDCWENSCGDTTADCNILLASLTTAEKNGCILPSYDFSNIQVQSNVTQDQQDQLIDWLCTGGSQVYDVYINGVDTGQDINFDGTDQTINLN